jgi:hypothetical protein
MNKAINLLLPEQDHVSHQRSLRILRIISLGSLFGIVAVSAGLFFLILASPLPGLRREETSVAAQLRGQRAKSAELFYIKERLAEVTGLLAKQPTFLAVVEKTARLLPEDAMIDRLSVETGSLSLTITSPSLLTIQSILEGMKQLKTEDSLFSTVTLSQLIYEEKRAGYAVTLHMRL